MLFDSRNLKHKTPFGAVASGTEVVFHVYPPHSWACTDVRIHIKEENTEREYSHRVDWRGFEGDCDDFRFILDTRNYLGLLWYYFSYGQGNNILGYIAPMDGHTGGPGVNYSAVPPVRYQLTVYEKSDPPDWYGKGITYQIFPDRFHRSKVPDPRGMVGNRLVHKNWNDVPNYIPDSNGEIKNSDFFGGDLKGIIQKLDYLKGIGVSTLYLSPIFESGSNHRYDTANYMKVDPMLGSEEDFTRLCEEARERGIRVLLDGVFNHTGFDSVYFNGRGTYPAQGAYQSTSSPFYPWYRFTNWPTEYSSWWGIYTLPQVNEDNPSFRDFIIGSKNSVIRKWLRLGASGWRLDVADELPDSFIEELRNACREEKADAVLIGEVWEDASNKVAYGQRRKYLLGNELDSVMNYPFRNAVIAFALGKSSAEFIDKMESLRENYPEPIFYSLMNSLGTHDTPRILTVLGATEEDWQMTRAHKSTSKLSAEQKEQAVRLLKIVSAIQFSFPGSPTIFYGDEAGAEGYEDPFNRRGYPWGKENAQLLEWYKKLGKLRSTLPALQSGSLVFHTSNHSVLAYSRSSGSDEEVLCLFSRSIREKVFTIPGTGWFDLLTGTVYPAKDGICEITIPPMSVIIAQKA
jgi:glycosidase